MALSNVCHIAPVAPVEARGWEARMCPDPVLDAYIS